MQNVMTVSYDTKIPNNVNLSSDRRVLKALEKWHPGYIDWWTKLIPQQFQDAKVYLRTAIGVETGGWAKFDYVKCRNIGGVSSLRRRSRIVGSRVASMPVRWRGRKYRANIAPCCVVLS